MNARPRTRIGIVILISGLLLLVGGSLVWSTDRPDPGLVSNQPDLQSLAAEPRGPTAQEILPANAEPAELSLSVSTLGQDVEAAAACSGTGPTVPGPVTLDQCYGRNITVGGNARTISVWYITDTTVYTVGTNVYRHWVLGESQAEDVADAVEEAWQALYVNSGIGGARHEPYLTGCSSNLNIQLEDGKGWSGIAYWASSGNCNIGIDAPMILNGVGTGDDGVVFHEMEHYVQFSYDDGCYDDFRPLYSSGNAWIEGWANWAGKNAVNAAGDADYSVSSYNPSNSYYDLDYTNLHAGYLIQQYGGNGAPSDPNFGIKAVYEHYRKCDQYDDVFVMDQTIKALTGGAKTEKWAFVDFLAAYYAYPYADPSTQRELVFPDADDVPTSSPPWSQDVALSTGSTSWTETSPEDWTARYYRIRPQPGCEYVQLEVETVPPGGEVGISFMATQTSAPTQVLRSSHIGDKAQRFYAGAGSNDELVAVVSSFDSIMTYDVTATCVAPSLDILEPRQNPGHAMVGAPASPVATLTRLKVEGSGGLGVSGIISTQIALDVGGDAATFVPGSFQEVGPGEYWGIMLPPAKSAGTTFEDYDVCLGGSICDGEIDALLYVEPGNTDVAYVVDESGSMATEDTPGEGARDVNARKALEVLKSLLRDGDRVALIGFGAENNPPGCGLPPDGTGSGNCPSANITRLPRTTVNIPGTLTAVQSAIDATGNRPLWTNIGQALIDAKDLLLANPGNTAPDFIYLLSDGRENVKPLYNDAPVKPVLQASGVRVNTIGFGPEAPGALLAQIAADTGGTYRPVATSGLGTTSLAAEETRATLDQLGVSAALAEVVVSAMPFLPGQLRLAEVYEDFDATSQDASRIFYNTALNVPDNTWSEWGVQVDKSADVLRFVVAGKQYDVDPACEGYHRVVDVLPPGATQREWIPISPRDPKWPAPAHWDIRNSPHADVLIVPRPEVGEWRIRTRYYYLVCQQGSDVAPAALESDLIMIASVQSTTHLEGRILGLDHNRGRAGDVVPLVATLVTRDGTIPGATVLGLVENQGGTDLVLLRDDGQHNDGAAGDGIYGWLYALTNHGGSYAVRLLAGFPDPANPSVQLIREWNGGFWILGPERENPDGDDMPTGWEEKYPCLDPRLPDGKGDPDRDGLVNVEEFERGTNPCRADTDRGGEMDGSEVQNQRNPLWPDDDRVAKLPHVEFRPLDRRVWISWSRPFSYTNMRLWVSTRKGEFGEGFDMGGKGEYILSRLTNDRPYYLTLQPETEGALGGYSDQHEVTPKEDTLAPQGAFYIGGPNVTDGGDRTSSTKVVLYVDATDELSYDGPASHSVGHAAIHPELIAFVVPSGGVEMRFSNDPRGLGFRRWAPLAPEVDWKLDCQAGEVCTVYGQFRDAAGNESLVLSASIRLGGTTIYLPTVLSNYR